MGWPFTRTFCTRRGPSAPAKAPSASSFTGEGTSVRTSKESPEVCRKEPLGSGRLRTPISSASTMAWPVASTMQSALANGSTAMASP